MTGVILGSLLLLLLIALVVLQGMIEWGGFDFDKLFKKKDPEPEAKTVKSGKAKKSVKKPAKKAKAKAKPKSKAKAKPKAKKKGKGKKK